MSYTDKERSHIQQRLEDAIMNRPGPLEITVTFRNGIIESVTNIVRGQSIVTRDIDDEGIHDHDLVIQRWYFDGSNEIIFEGEIENEKLKPVERSRII